jgi:predicted RNA polymerase sigma factor
MQWPGNTGTFTTSFRTIWQDRDRVVGHNGQRIVDLYDVLVGLVPGPVVALNRAIAIAELRGPGIGLDLLRAMAQEQRLSTYPFYWAALANLESRAGRSAEARSLYERAMGLSRSPAERVSYERRLKLLN